MAPRAAGRRTLEVLEFDRVLDYVAGFAGTGPGAEAIRSLRPAADERTVRHRLAAVEETVRFLDGRSGWVFPDLPDARGTLGRLSLDGSVLSPAGLARVGAVLEAGASLERALAGGCDGLPVLQALKARLLSDPRLRDAIGRSVDAEGTVRDGASRELRLLRNRLRRAHNRVVQHLERLLGGIDERHRVPRASVTIREGRYVIPVRREGKRAVGGYIHDESSSGATVFVEPPSAIERMNQVRELERAEAREVQRILRRLTERCRPLAAGLAESLAALTRMDTLVARARAAERWRGEVPEITDAELRIRAGRHPILAAGGGSVVPFDIELDPRERVVVVTGPNTGGKTVFLKSVGLIAALTQSGVIPPAGPGTRLPVFDAIFADIGDEQSITDSLSTFSAHLRNLQEVLTGTGPRSLVLVDEPGVGTDPKEGEALARALIETLARRGCIAVVTSHMGGLKRLAAPGNGIVNAALEFDGERLAPTYRFAKGRPGRSYGLAIARGLGFPKEVLDLADGYRDRSEVRLDELLEALEGKEREVSRLVAALESERRRVAAMEGGLRAREAAVRRSEREHAEQARKEARRMLLDARREVEAAIAGLRDGARAGGSLEHAATKARRSVEEAARALERPAEVRREALAEPGPAIRLEPGASVRMTDTGARGTVSSVEGDRAVVVVGGVRMRVSSTRLVPAADGGPRPSPGTRAAPGPPAWSGEIPDPATEVDLRGQRADEAELALARALDEAAVADLRELRIVHGKGTGALRKRVAAVLESDGRVERFRPGRPAEGGYGVTVARIG